MRWDNRLALIGLLSATTLCVASAHGQEVTGEAEIDFYRHVQPIFSSQCLTCHGPEQQLGGLRLDRRADAERGGYSGVSIREASENNELLKRITEENSALRMPKDRPALSASQIKALEDWIAAGAPWPDRPKRFVPPTKVFGITVPDSLVERVKAVDDTLEFHPLRRLLLALFLMANLAILLVERKKREWNPATTGEETDTRRIAQIGWIHYAAMYGLFGVSLVLGISWGGWNDAEKRLQQAERQLEDTTTKLKVATSTDIEAIFGNPPVPFRPSHAPTMSKVYYRGNCERSPQLFNNGFYRTAELEVTIVDANGEPMQIGDAISAEGMAVRFRLRRSPGATPGHFTKEVIGNTCLSETYFSRTNADNAVINSEFELIPLTTITEDGEWEARYPIRVSPNGGSVSEGLIYIYYGMSPDKEATVF